MNQETLLSQKIANAKTLYTAWAQWMGVHVAFERLSLKETRAWQDVAETATDGETLHGLDHTCSLCHDQLTCQSCDPKTECDICDEPLICPRCDYLTYPDCLERLYCVCCDLGPIPFCVGESR